jgi:hypothetical protein
MALEFNKLVEQVTRLGAMVEKLDFDTNERLQIARQRYREASDLDAINERIQLVRQSDISGYRGAAPLDAPYTEPINQTFTAPQPPDRATIIAADGSQIYPDDRAPVHFYVINIGMFIYHCGLDHLPQQITVPVLAFHKDHVHDRSQRVISNRTVDARRTVAEMRHLAEKAWELRHEVDHSLVALYDNTLMFWANADITGADQLLKDYWGAMQTLYDVQANGTRMTLAGYVDNPRSSTVLRLLYLMSLRDEQDIKQNERKLSIGGDLEGLRDRHLFSVLLRPGERSALMVQNSPRNLEYKDRGESYEIAFFYVKVGDSARSVVARVDLPMWVARDKTAVDELHALLLQQCTMQGRNPYPYALTRADELAYVSGKDKRKLDELINIELRRKGIGPVGSAAKVRGKELARSDRRNYEPRTDLPQDHPF